MKFDRAITEPMSFPAPWKVPLVALRKQHQAMEAEIEKAVRSVIASCSFVDGSAVDEFEGAFARYCGTAEAVAVDSGTAALQLSLLALNVGPGDEVLVPTQTFIATASAVALVGARPVFVDADEENWQLAIAEIDGKRTARCRGIIGVHLYGQPLPMTQLLDLARQKNLSLIEDAAQAHGGRFQGQRVGSFGTTGCFSFYPSKNLGAYGDGGMIVTNDSPLAQRLRSLKNHGRTNQYEHSEVGFNYRMDSLQAAILGVKLPHLDEWNQRRRQWACRYRERLAPLPIQFPRGVPETEPVYHLFPIRTRAREKLVRHLAARGVETGIHYPVPLHLQPAFRHLGYVPGDFPVAERVSQEILSLPIFPEMTSEQFEIVCNALEEFFYATDAGREARPPYCH